jgi:hypothetical protein
MLSLGRIGRAKARSGVAIGGLTVSAGASALAKGANHVVDGVIAGWLLSLGLGNAAYFAINRAGAERRLLQCEAFGELAQVVR